MEMFKRWEKSFPDPLQSTLEESVRKLTEEKGNGTNHDLASASCVNGEICVFQGVHVEMHCVSTSVRLKCACHCRGRRRGEVSIDKKAVSALSAAGRARSQCPEFFILRAGPVARASEASPPV
jgi:hypothetical protein